MTLKSTRSRVGELRPTQLMFTFGVGSVVELPYLSVMVLGLDDWERTYLRALAEPRLLRAVRGVLGGQVERLCQPPMTEEGFDANNALDEAARVGVPVSTFPRWMRCPSCNLLASVETRLFVLKTNPYRPERARYEHEGCPRASKRAPTVLPARFLVACSAGHLDDFPWHAYLHGEGSACSGSMRLRETGVTGTAADVLLACDACEQRKSLALAFDPDQAERLGPCRGTRPHLRDTDESGCSRPVRPILLGASNAWFPILLSTLYIPPRTDALGEVVEKLWDKLQGCKTVEAVEIRREYEPSLAPFTPQELFERIDARRQGGGGGSEEDDDEELKAPEWRVFSAPDPTLNGSDFSVRETDRPPGYEPYLARVVLVERLREVHAILGFTRIESPGDMGGAMDVPRDRRAPLSRKDPTWVPAAEVRGEGLFIQFDEARIQAWVRSDEVLRRSRLLSGAHERWRRIRGIEPAEAGFPGMRYALLHSFAHALMRQLSLECGYTAASLRERIYAADPEDEGGPMAGILIYTAAPDSEGTLGGLVSLGDPATLARHFDQALDSMRLCSSDPLCSERLPGVAGLTLHGASCHACLFAAETSCERGNKYLDRSLLVETVSEYGAAFFFRPAEAGVEKDGPVAEEAAPAVEVGASPAESPPTAEGAPTPDEPPGQVEAAGVGFPVYRLTDLGGAVPPFEWRVIPGLLRKDGQFLMRMEGDSLDQRVAPGTWCVFQQMVASDSTPPQDSIVIAAAADGPVVRRLFWSMREDADATKKYARVVLRANSSRVQPPIVVEVPEAEWPSWRPLARFVGTVSSLMQEKGGDA